MTIESLKSLLSDLCHYHNVDITHTFTINKTQSLKVRCLTFNSQHIFELVCSNCDKVELINDIDVAAKAIQNIITKNTPI
ncbi:hypothetical protein [Peribacillus sp. NPDC058075]|uniref:hypothetical protein n=1 Tax=unclassified Peribacillus TaxID=2675266 RepID=UPI0036DDA6C9